MLEQWAYVASRTNDMVSEARSSTQTMGRCPVVMCTGRARRPQTLEGPRPRDQLRSLRRWLGTGEVNRPEPMHGLLQREVPPT